MGLRILIVEDEPDLAQTLEYSLSKEGFVTEVSETGRGALEMALATPPDLILLDLMLPDIGGLDVCRELRAHESTKNVPIVITTARGEEIDRVVGFEVGADDYVVKPFSMRELLLRIRAILRRSKPAEDDAGQDFGELRVDDEAHEVYVSGLLTPLTALEFKLLRTLMRTKGKVQSRDKLLENVWEITAKVTTRTVDTHVKRLREKLGVAGGYIETVRGTGYRFAKSP